MASGYIASWTGGPESQQRRRRVASQPTAVVASSTAAMSGHYDACARDLICEIFTGTKAIQRTYAVHGLNTYDHGKAVRRKVKAIPEVTQKAMKVAAMQVRRQNAAASTPAAAASTAGGMDTDLSLKMRSRNVEIASALKDTPRDNVSTAFPSVARTCSSYSTACVQDKVKLLTRAMADEGLSQTDAAKLLRDSGCDKWSEGSLGRMKRERPGESPSKGGKQTYLPAWVEQKVVEFCIVVRKLAKTVVTWDEVVAWTQGVCENSEELAKFKNGLDYAWFHRWLGRHSDQLSQANARPLEICRETWCTAENMGMHFVQVAELLVRNGAAQWNDDFDFRVRHSQMVNVTHPQLVCSFDESDGTLDQTKDRQKSVVVVTEKLKKDSNGNIRKVKVKETDSIANKVSAKASFAGGSIMSGHQVRPNVTFPGGSYDCRWTDGWGTQTPIFATLPDGSQQSCSFYASGKGGSCREAGLKLIRDNIIPSLNANDSIGQEFEMKPEPSWRYSKDQANWARRSHCADETLYGMEPGSRQQESDEIDWILPQRRGRKGTVLCDGLGDHFSEPVCQELNRPTDLRMHPCDMALRVPHTTHESQGEDTPRVSTSMFKPEVKK